MSGLSSNRDKIVLHEYKAKAQVEKKNIAQVKRFVELCLFDKKVESSILDSRQEEYVRDRFKKTGVQLDLKDFRPLLTGDTAVIISRLCNEKKKELHDFPGLEKELRGYPAISQWLKWRRGKIVNTPGEINVKEEDIKNKPFLYWFQRRIRAINSELGHYGKNMNHALFSFELSKGCSVGCSFCAFGAKKLSENFEYNEKNRALWRGVLKTCVDFFGQSIRGSLCYSATEPFDNQHYLEFIQDYQDITGDIAFTSTAAPLKDIAAFRRLLSYYRNLNKTKLKISVLTSAIGRKILETYTPDELVNVDLIDQTKNTDRKKAVSGKVRYWGHNNRGSRSDGNETQYIPPSSIECVSGFLVNMVDRNIKLISPCKASDTFPYGYRIFAEESFADGPDFAKKIQEIMDSQIVQSIDGSMVMAFRDDLSFEIKANKIHLNSLYQGHNFSGDSSLLLLGQLIAEKKYSYSRIVKELRENGANLLVVSGMVKRFFEDGFLDEILMKKGIC